jgi:branched-chain amino acid transport system substrate-binding protein
VEKENYMKIDTKNMAVSRRNVLKMLGISSGVLMAGSPLTPFSMFAANSKNRTIRVGVLNLKSPAASQIANETLAGIRIYANTSPGLTIHTVLREFDGGMANCVTAYNSLVNKSGVDVVLGVTNRNTTQQLKETIHAQRIPYFEISAGERVADRADYSPYIFRSTLGMWQSGYLVGGWAAQNVGRRAFVASSVEECGYHHLEAFRHGFENHNGTVVSTVVTNAPANPISAAECVSQIKQAGPDLVHCLYTGAERDEFLNAFRSAGLQGKIPIVGGLGFAAPTNGVLQVSTWNAALQNDANVTFVKSYATLFGKQPNAFAALGFDTAMLIDSAKLSYKSSMQFAANLRTATAEGCSGAISVKGLSQSVNFPVYISGEYGSGGYKQIEIGIATDAEIAETHVNQKSGWTNAYSLNSGGSSMLSNVLS